MGEIRRNLKLHGSTLREKRHNLPASNRGGDDRVPSRFGEEF